MLDSVRKFAIEFFGHDQKKHDNRKWETGSLNQIRNRPKRLSRKDKTKMRYRIEKPDYYLKAIRPHQDSNVIKTKESKSRIGGYSNRSSNIEKKNKLSLIFRSLKSIFSNEEVHLRDVQNVCGNINKKVIPTGDDKYCNNVRNKIEKSDAFKWKINELKYDKVQLNKLKRLSDNSELRSRNYRYGRNVFDDKVKLLELENKKLKKELSDRELEVIALKRRLRFSIEKNKLLLSDSYLASLSADVIDSDLKPLDNFKENESRDIKETQHFGASPSIEFSSKDDASIRNNRFFREEELGSLDLDEEKNKSFSPIRIDYSRYSNP